MIKVSELAGAQLDYWVARAEGVPATQLFFYQTPYTLETVCGRRVPNTFPAAVQYSTDWAHGGPLIENYALSLQPDCHMDVKDMAPGAWYSQDWQQAQDGDETSGDTPLQAICRAVVRAAFGDEVEEVA